MPALFVPSLLTHTGASRAVQSQTFGTLAAERALGVHTLAICAHAGEHFTLIDVYRDRGFFLTHTKASTFLCVV